jgi:hypothetical protein
MVSPNTDVGIVVWVDITPNTIRLGDTTTLEVRLHTLNPGDDEIRVRSGGPPYAFTNDPARSRGLWGSVRFGDDDRPLDAGPGIDWWGDSVYVFPSRAYDRADHTYKLKDWTTGGWTLRPGVLRVRGWFNGREGRGTTLTILPPV